MHQQNSVVQIGKFSFYPAQVLGMGATGQVHKGFRNHDKLPVAVKKIRLADVNSPVKMHLLQCEVNALRNIKNKYICEVFDVLKDPEYYFIPLQLCPNGTLRSYIQSKGRLSEAQSLKIFQQVVDGYCGIRQSGFIHRDLKSQNILFRANMEPAIIDFGYCQKIEIQGQRLSYNVGSPAYMSPEAYIQSMYSEKSDVWALGVIFHEMLTGDIPIMRTTDADQYFNYLSKMKTAQLIPTIRNAAYIKILLSALTVDVQHRASAQKLKSMLAQVAGAGSPPKTKTNSVNLYQAIQSPTRAQQQNRINQKLNTIHNTRQVKLFGNQSNSNVVYENINQPNQKYSYKPSSNSGYVEKSPLRVNYQQDSQQAQELAFGALRKRILTNPTFNENLTPIRVNIVENKPLTTTPRMFKNSNSQMTQDPIAQITSQRNVGNMKRVHSSNSLSAKIIQHH